MLPLIELNAIPHARSEVSSGFEREEIIFNLRAPKTSCLRSDLLIISKPSEGLYY